MKRRGSREDVRKLAHDLNNLLTAIIGATDAILERSALDPETRQDLAHVREGARRGTAVIRRLRGDASNAVAVPRMVSVNETIRSVYRLLDHSLGATVTLTLDLWERDGHVLVDPAQLDRALLNLITNARHAMPDGGTVTLATYGRALAIAEAHVPDTVPAGNYVVIRVADSGRGIPREQLSGIFNSGVSSRRNAGGSGLGLPSTRDIVHEANGCLTVASAEGLGTRFEIYLPRIDGVRCPATATEAAGPTVLLVEDDLLVRNVTERNLLRAGWTVRCAGSAEEALAVLQHGMLDLMISDIALPEMHGVALAQLVRAQLPEVPIVLTSGYDRSAMHEVRQLANVLFLTKPYGQTELMDAIARAGCRANCRND